MDHTSLFSLLEAKLTESLDTLDWSDGLIRTPGPGHTRETAHLTSKHEGVYAVELYAAASFFGQLDDARGTALLQEIVKLQLTEAGDPAFGGFRRFREETRPSTTNSAFFMMQPLAVLQVLAPQRIPAAHQPLLDTLGRNALVWFKKECRDPILYYSNKILSDAAILTALSVLLDDAEGQDLGVAFFQRWDDYTHRRGWGWGENLSIHYLPIILSALQLARLVLQASQPTLAEKLDSRIRHLLEYIRFHSGRQFVPVLRTYNGSGQTDAPGWIQTVAGVRQSEKDWFRPAPQNFDYSALVGLFLMREYLPSKPALDSAVGRNRTERIFEDAAATTWVGEHVRLGSLNRFPVIAGSYGYPTWGLGWQSMPVSFLVEGHQVGYLRYTATVAGEPRHHPALGFGNYLKNALFAESTLPELHTRSAQSGPLLIVLRSLPHLANKASDLRDSWLVPRFEGTITQIEGWQVLQYPEATVALRALTSLVVGASAAAEGIIDVETVNGDLLLHQVLYHGPEVELRQERLETGWAVVTFDRALSAELAQAELAALTLEDSSWADGEIPRDGLSLRRRVKLAGLGAEALLEFDPRVAHR